MNKVKFVLLAVSSMLAMAFTLSSCSGEDGKNGKDGTSCTLDGKVLTCGDKMLTIKDGEDGGAGGTKGDKGDDGIGCDMEQDGEGPAVITCGDKTVLIPTCGGEIYSPATEVCDSQGELYSVKKIGEQWWMTQNLKDGDNDDGKFTWAQAMAAGVCPIGWSLPSKADFDVLVASSDKGNWGTSSAGDQWWSSTVNTEAETMAHALQYTASLSLTTQLKSTPILVRCIKD
ncbi:MAG: hypothetical protein LBH25_05630 [Fibromonadaceae bacterium]|nr:hypothetical protein [Fibromonadaceae bacterium]